MRHHSFAWGQLYGCGGLCSGGRRSADGELDDCKQHDGDERAGAAVWDGRGFYGVTRGRVEPDSGEWADRAVHAAALADEWVGGHVYFSMWNAAGECGLHFQSFERDGCGEYDRECDSTDRYGAVDDVGTVGNADGWVIRVADIAGALRSAAGAAGVETEAQGSAVGGGAGGDCWSHELRGFGWRDRGHGSSTDLYEPLDACGDILDSGEHQCKRRNAQGNGFIDCGLAAGGLDLFRLVEDAKAIAEAGTQTQSGYTLLSGPPCRRPVKRF